MIRPDQATLKMTETMKVEPSLIELYLHHGHDVHGYLQSVSLCLAVPQPPALTESRLGRTNDCHTAK